MSLHDLENSINIGDRFYFICGYTDEIIKTSILKVFCNTATSKFSISYKNPNHRAYISGTEKNNFTQCCSINECFLTEESAQQYKKYQKSLIAQVDAVAEEIETWRFYSKEEKLQAASDFLKNRGYNIIHHVNQDGDHLGAEIIITPGGVSEPEITIRTKNSRVFGHHRSAYYSKYYSSIGENNHLDLALKDIYRNIDNDRIK